MTPRDRTSSRNLAHPPPLDAHAGQANDVCQAEAREIDLLDVFIDQRHVMLVRHQRGQQGQAGHREVRALSQQPDAVFHSPERNIETRIDDDDISHGLSQLHVQEHTEGYRRNVAVKRVT
jgi:hypothetical protein